MIAFNPQCINRLGQVEQNFHILSSKYTTLDTHIEQLDDKVTTMDTRIIRMDTKTDDMYDILYAMACKRGALTHSPPANHRSMLGRKQERNIMEADDMELDGMASKLAEWGNKDKLRLTYEDKCNNE